MYYPIDKEGGVGLEGNDAWDDWFGSKVDVPGHTGEGEFIISQYYE